MEKQTGVGIGPPIRTTKGLGSEGGTLAVVSHTARGGKHTTIKEADTAGAVGDVERDGTHPNDDMSRVTFTIDCLGCQRLAKEYAAIELAKERKEQTGSEATETGEKLETESAENDTTLVGKCHTWTDDQGWLYSASIQWPEKLLREETDDLAFETELNIDGDRQKEVDETFHCLSKHQPRSDSCQAMQQDELAAIQQYKNSPSGSPEDSLFKKRVPPIDRSAASIDRPVSPIDRVLVAIKNELCQAREVAISNFHTFLVRKDLVLKQTLQVG
eukprot:GHVT01093988.1.p1 GENE.GHVT01093988.1~~GHVT01093988.1.p1  ORF type:complete len:273 (-),score=31.11 GHVT01093988.1:78-896(-)